MIADFLAQINKFLYEVSYLVKTECRNAVLLGDMNISRLMIHAKQVGLINLGKFLRRKIWLGLGSMTILNRNLVVEITRIDD